MVALFVAATVVTLMQVFHTRQRRLIPLALLFVFQALAHSREPWDAWQNRFHLCALAAGLVLLVSLSHPRFAPPGRNQTRTPDREEPRPGAEGPAR